MISVHRFNESWMDSGHAYNATQCDDQYRDGDVLVIEKEGVFGFLNEAWPVAVSEATGEFHAPVWDKFKAEFGDRYDASIQLAVRLYTEWKRDPSTATVYRIEYNDLMHGGDDRWDTYFCTYDGPLAADCYARHEDTSSERFWRVVDVKTGEVVLGSGK